jgi:hypothetical protein
MIRSAVAWVAELLSLEGIYKMTVGVGVITDRAKVKTPVGMAWSLALAYSRHMIRSAAARVAGIDVSALTSLEGGLCLFLVLVNLNVGIVSSVKLIPASSFLNRVHVMRSGFLWWEYRLAKCSFA